jgi:hypothetical protein
MAQLGQNTYWVKSPYVCVLSSQNLDRDLQMHWFLEGLMGQTARRR